MRSIELIADAYRFISLLWGLLLIIVGIPCSLAVLATPWSSKPALCLAIGVGGILAQGLGAFIVHWTLRVPTTSRARAPARALPGESA